MTRLSRLYVGFLLFVLRSAARLCLCLSQMERWAQSPEGAPREAHALVLKLQVALGEWAPPVAQGPGAPGAGVHHD